MFSKPLTKSIKETLLWDSARRRQLKDLADFQNVLTSIEISLFQTFALIGIRFDDLRQGIGCEEALAWLLFRIWVIPLILLKCLELPLLPAVLINIYVEKVGDLLPILEHVRRRHAEHLYDSSDLVEFTCARKDGQSEEELDANAAQ